MINRRLRVSSGLRSLAATLIVLLAIAGCSSSGLADRASRATSQTTEVDLPLAATGSVQSAYGDSVLLGVSVGAPRAASDISEASACTFLLNRAGGMQRAVAVPLRITATLTSSVMSDIEVYLGNGDQLTEDGRITLANPVHWAVAYDDVPPRCEASAASVRWSGMSPQSTNSWVVWAVIPNGATPDDPTGQLSAGALVLSPIVELSGQRAFPVWAPSPGNVVQCSASDPAAGLFSYIALVPSVAVDHGCTSATAQSAAEQANSRICLQHYPAEQQVTRTDDRVTIHNYVASMYQVCSGFGTKAEFTWTPEMTCAFIAIVADYGRVDVPLLRPTDNLCSATSVAEAYANDSWLGFTGSEACNFFSNTLATGTGILAAGTAAPVSGPGAVAVGVVTYRAIKTGIGVTCGGVFSGAFAAAGQWLEARHQANVAVDVSRKGLCLAESTSFGNRWAAVPCPDY